MLMFPVQEFTCTCANVCIVAPYHNVSDMVITTTCDCVCVVSHSPLTVHKRSVYHVLLQCVCYYCLFVVTGPPLSLSFTVNPGIGNIIVAVTQVSIVYTYMYT